jgi:hypothetical protein
VLVMFLLCCALVFLGLGTTLRIICGLLAAVALFAALYVGGWLLLILLASVIA